MKLTRPARWGLAAYPRCSTDTAVVGGREPVLQASTVTGNGSRAVLSETLNGWRGTMLDTLGLPELALVVVVVVLVVVPASRICVKAGYPAWLGALALLPVLNVALVFFLAFAKWPIEKQLELAYHRGPKPPGVA
jgi:hypothetical protein